MITGTRSDIHICLWNHDPALHVGPVGLVFSRLISGQMILLRNFSEFFLPEQDKQQPTLQNSGFPCTLLDPGRFHALQPHLHPQIIAL